MYNLAALSSSESGTSENGAFGASSQPKSAAPSELPAAAEFPVGTVRPAAITEDGGRRKVEGNARGFDPDGIAGRLGVPGAARGPPERRLFPRGS